MANLHCIRTAARVVAALAIASAIHAVSTTAAAAPRGSDHNQRIADLAERYFQQRMALDPHNALSVLGEAKYERGLRITIAPAEIAASRAQLQRTLRELTGAGGIDRARLDEREQLNYDLLRDEVETALAGFAFPGHLLPVDSFGGLSLLIANYGSGDQIQPFKTAANYDNYLARLRRLPAWNAQAVANMREGMRVGVVMPKALIVAALPQIKAMTEPDFDKSVFAASLQRMPENLPEADRKRIAAAYRRAFDRELLPSSVAFVNFLEHVYLPKCRDTAGIGALPNGRAYYAYLVKLFTTTTLTPDAIHDIGLREVARIRAEMQKIQQHYAFDGTLTEFLKWQDAAAQFMPYKTEAEVLAGYAEIDRKVTAQLPRFFGRLPTAPLAIKPVPELLRATGSAYYVAAAPDGTRPGTFYAWFNDPAKLNTAMMSSLFLHEGKPGHHFQAAFAQQTSLPKFRRYGWTPALGEGWALYAETLGHDQGLYADPNQYLGHLKLELLRAVRLVTDTGLHAKGWTREQTMQYMIDTEGATEAWAKNATERYMAWPGQALAYKIGSLEVQRLRDHARTRLGAKFSLSAFHDVVLSEGTVPLNVLAQIVERWIAKQEQA